MIRITDLDTPSLIIDREKLPIKTLHIVEILNSTI